MKIISKLFIALILFCAGYLLGSYFPLKGFIFMRSVNPSIFGQAELQVTVLHPDRTPAVGLEVDIATEVGKVLEGGHVNTDARGVAAFNIQPGNYYIFFNAINFPKNLEYRDTPQVTVSESKTANKIIILQTKAD